MKDINKNDLILKRLENQIINGSEFNRGIAKIIYEIVIKQDIEKCNTILKFSEVTSISNASVTRFIKTAGWSAFQHFVRDFMNYACKDINSKPIINKSISIKKNTKISKMVSGEEIKLICSKKSTHICEYIVDVASDIGVYLKMFQPTKNKIENFIDATLETDVLF